MSKLTDIVAELETKFARLLHDMEQLKGEKKVLTQKFEAERDRNNQLMQQQNELNNQLANLKAINALLGSDEYKRETKLKINSLVREIDYCIAQLSD